MAVRFEKPGNPDDLLYVYRVVDSDGAGQDILGYEVEIGQPDMDRLVSEWLPRYGPRARVVGPRRMRRRDLPHKGQTRDEFEAAWEAAK